MVGVNLKAAFKTLLVSVLLTLCAPNWAIASRVHGYETIKALSLEIMSRASSKDFVYVGVGRSPTPIIAYLENAVGKHSAFQISLSGRYRERAINDPIVHEQIMNHLDQELAPIIQHLNGRKLMFLDFVSSGEGLCSALGVIEIYLKKYRSDINFEYLALARGRSVAIDGWPGIERTVDLEKHDRFFLNMLGGSGFDDYSPVGQWGVVGLRVYEVPPNLKAAQDFRSDLAEMFKSDPDSCSIVLNN